MNPKIIVVAATKGGVGKSTIAVHLAVARAHESKRVLLIDATTQRASMRVINQRERLPVRYRRSDACQRLTTVS